MGLFNRGQAASALILDGKRAVRAYLGEELIWDGTTPAYIDVPVIAVSAAMLPPVVRADTHRDVPLISIGAAMNPPSVSGSSSVRPETAIIVTAVMLPPSATADSAISVPRIDVSAIMLAPVVSESYDGTVDVPLITVDSVMLPPKIAVDFVGAVPPISVIAEMLTPIVTATGTAVVNAPLIPVSATLLPPAVSSTVKIAPPLIAATATMLPPELRRDGKVSPPLITAAASMYVPVVQAINFAPSGMTKNGSAQNWTGDATVQVTGMVAESGSTLSGSALLPNGAKTGATVNAQVSISNTNFMPSITAELRKNNVLVPGGSVTVSTISTSTATLTIPTRTVDVVATDQFTLHITPSSSMGGTVAAGVNTFVRIT